MGISTVRDRVVQAAAKLVLEPIFEVDFVECSHGFRPGRSATGALEKVRLRSSGNKGNHVFDADIRDFFGSLDREILMKRVQLRVSDRLQPTTAAETTAAFEATVRAYEALVRERPEQWLLFEDVWRERVAERGAYEMVPQASGLRLR